MTSDLMQRVHQHRTRLLEGFTHRHEVARLVWFLHGEAIAAAIALEKKIRNRGRRWKIAPIEKGNPNWNDLAASWLSAASRNEAPDRRTSIDMCTIAEAPSSSQVR